MLLLLQEGKVFINKFYYRQVLLFLLARVARLTETQQETQLTINNNDLQPFLLLKVNSAN